VDAVADVVTTVADVAPALKALCGKVKVKELLPLEKLAKVKGAQPMGVVPTAEEGEAEGDAEPAPDLGEKAEKERWRVPVSK